MVRGRSLAAGSLLRLNNAVINLAFESGEGSVTTAVYEVMFVRAVP